MISMRNLVAALAAGLGPLPFGARFTPEYLNVIGAIVFCLGVPGTCSAAADFPAGSTMIALDYARYLAPIDLHFTKPTKPVEGIPLGNGKMGTLVWVDGAGSRLEFNFGRPDVFFMGSATTTWNNKSHTDGNSKVGHVEISFAESPFARTCHQDLHAYDGYGSIQGSDVSARIVAWRDRDVFALEITDNRAAPSAITVALKGMQPDLTTNLYHRSSTPSQQSNLLVLKQVFHEKCDTGMAVNDFYCTSACVIAVQGRTAAATDSQLTIPAAKGTFSIYIGSAAALTPKEDVVTLASAEVKAALATTFHAIFASTTAHWHDFWRKSFIYLPATHDRPFDESFDQHWLYYLYCMNTCQRGKFPIHANGGIFNVQDGWQYWGSMYWWFNSSRQTLTPVFEQANHPELADPYFSMLSRQLPRINQAAIQQWGAAKDAIYLQETFGFDGPEVLPDTIAADLKNTFVNNAGQSQALDKFRKSRSAWESRWSMGSGSAGYHTHLLYNTAEAAQWYWERYEYTGDLVWLKDRAYPMVKGAAELYRTHPLTKLEADGFYHANNLGWAETYRNGVRDGINDLASIRGIFPVAIKAAKLLNTDADLVPLWQDMLDKLAPYPTDATPQAMGVLQRAGEPVFAIGVGGHSSPGSDHDPRLMMVNIFDLVNTESKLTKPDEWQMAMNTLAGLKQAKWIALNKNEGAGGGGASPLARFCGEAARLGSVEWVKNCFLYQQSYWKMCQDAPTRWINRIREYNPEGGFALDWQQEATFSEGLSAALLQSGAASPGGTPVIRVFPAWPKEMDASFSLRAKGDFLVTSMMKSGNVDFIEVTSQRGGSCTLRNIWGKQNVDLYRNQTKCETLTTELLTFATKAGENIVVVKSGAKPTDFCVTIPEKQR